MTKLEMLNKLLADRKLDIPAMHRSVDKHGTNIKWLKKHLATRNQEHESFTSIQNLLAGSIGSLVNDLFTSTT
jgi:hypothetical protein